MKYVLVVLWSQDALSRDPQPPTENNYACVADAIRDGKLHRIRSNVNQNQQPPSTGGFVFAKLIIIIITLITGEPRVSTCLFQQLSIALQGGNSVAFLNSFDSD